MGKIEGQGFKTDTWKEHQVPVLKAEVTDYITGITRVVETQGKIVAAAAESNLQ